MSSKEIALWLDERWYQALSRQLGKETVEDKLNDYLNQLIDQLPERVRERISGEIRDEEQQRKQALDAVQKFSAFRVTENGVTEHFRMDRPVGLLETARCVRTTLRQEPGPRPFREMFHRPESITAEEFDTMAAARSAQSCKVAAAFDIDFDRMEFSTVRPFTGWATYKLNDVSTAVWYAERCGSYEWAVRQARLVEKLAGREICSAGHLSMEDFTPAEEICEMDGHRLNFYLETGFDVDKVFGTRTAKRAEQMNLYANYDMSAGQVCDELELVLVHASGKEEALTYPLNAVEKAALLRKMEDYCEQQTGLSLKDYSAQRLAESEGAEQKYGPKMEM
jgi:hypothetical protein